MNNWQKLGLTIAVVLLIAVLAISFRFIQRSELFSRGPVVPIQTTLSPSLVPQSPASTLPASTTTILFAGDIMFDRNIRAAAKRQGNDFIFAPLKETLLNYDLVVANLEGPITDNPSKSLGSVVGSPANFTFTFDPSLSQTLSDHNIKVVNLGNNHILNFGQAGLDQTLKNLSQAQIGFFGYTGTEAADSASIELSPSYIWQHNNQTIAFINSNQFVAAAKTETAKSTALAEIQRLRPQVDWIVIYTHWDNEYQPVASTVTTNLAHQFIDAGADLIIGSHPHVIQNHEVYQGKHIYYSLGNFVFDQYFQPEVKKGLMVEVTFSNETGEISVNEIPITLETNGQTRLAQ